MAGNTLSISTIIINSKGVRMTGNILCALQVLLTLENNNEICTYDHTDFIKDKTD